jgi:zinc and cadmium transporter
MDIFNNQHFQENNVFLWIMGASVIIALLGFAGVFSFWVSKKNMDKILHLLVAFAAGTLLGGAFFHLLPESMEGMEARLVLGLVLAGFVFFTVIESYFHWHRCKECDIHPFSYMIVVGDAIHNFLCGVSLAASFFAGINVGIATTIAVIAHELPQQLGIFGVLVKGGFKKNKAILYSFASQSTVILGALAGFYLSTLSNSIIPFLIPFAAGNFIYIAASDLVPEMHKTEGMNKLVSMLVFGLGLLFMLMLKGTV